MRRFFFPVLLMGAAALAHAVPPVHGPVPGVRVTCHVNKTAMRERVSALRAARALQTLPTKSTMTAPAVLVIRVDFTDLPMTDMLPATAEALFQEVRNYYRENSYDLFSPTFTVTSNVYHLPNPLSYYGADVAGDPSANDDKLVSDSTGPAALDGIVFTNYDHLMIYHAGNGQESPPYAANDIWSLYQDHDVVAGGKTFTGYTVVPELEGGKSPHGTICHEYGHQLGLPDLYDTDRGISTVGAWDVMDYPYGDAPADTPHMGAWSKYFIGFSAPSDATGTVTLAPAESDPAGFVRLPHPGAAAEVFLMEFRWRANTVAQFDKGLPVAPTPPGTGGLALWHVDESMVAVGSLILLNNVVNAAAINGTGHVGVDLIVAPGGIHPGATDAGTNDLFTDGEIATGDRTQSFGGGPSGLTVAVRSGSDVGPLLLDIVGFAAAPSVAVLKTISYPNPGGNPSRYPIRAGAPAGTVMTLVVQLSRPLPSNAQIAYDIYDLNGQRVRSVTGESFGLKVGSGEPTSDNKWVYEYDWDGRDDSGRDLPSGVYLTRVKAGGETKKGKLVILR